METYAIRRRGAWASAEELEAAGVLSRRVGDEMADRLRWIRSYIVEEPDGRLGSICIYQASDRAAIREHGQRIGADSDDVQPVVATEVVRPDPVAAAAA